MSLATRPALLARSALAASLALALAACGSSDDDDPPAASATPELRLTITATEDFEGSYGDVGAYEKLTGRLDGEVDPRTRTTPSSRTWRSHPSTRVAWSSTAPSS